MIIIKGMNGKSVKLREYLKDIDANKALIIDSCNVPQIFPDGVNVLTIEKPVEDILAMFNEIHENTNLDYYVFYVNTDESNILKFKKIEQVYNVEVVVTVQSHADENLRETLVYSI